MLDYDPSLSIPGDFAIVQTGLVNSVPLDIVLLGRQKSGKKEFRSLLNSIPVKPPNATNRSETHLARSEF
jgi:hypothetical protein